MFSLNLEISLIGTVPIFFFFSFLHFLSKTNQLLRGDGNEKDGDIFGGMQCKCVVEVVNGDVGLGGLL